MTTSFYKYLSNGDIKSSNINYVSASGYTEAYTGAGSTLFELFDLFVIPIYVNLNEMVLTVADLKKK
jgi:hypothetical protein